MGTFKRMRRKKAVELCRERGFAPGDVLVSDAWKKPRKIAAIQPNSVLYTIGNFMDIAVTFPEDVRKADDATTE